MSSSNISEDKSFFKIPFSFRAMLLQFYKNEKIKIQIHIDLIKDLHWLKTDYWSQIYKNKYGAIGNSMLCYETLRDLCNCSFLTMVKSSFSSSSDKFGQSDWTLRTTFFIILSSRPWTKTFTENWVGKQSFFVVILTTAEKGFF